MDLLETYFGVETRFMTNEQKKPFIDQQPKSNSWMEQKNIERQELVALTKDVLKYGQEQDKINIFCHDRSELEITRQCLEKIPNACVYVANPFTTSIMEHDYYKNLEQKTQ